MDGQQKNVEQQVALIRQSMPQVYQAVKAKAEQIGNDAYAHVRAGLRGEPNRFYAFENGRVVGTPFSGPIQADVAQQMVQFGATFLCIWPCVSGGAHGAN